jgi:hypothetical protein
MLCPSCGTTGSAPPPVHPPCPAPVEPVQEPQRSALSAEGCLELNPTVGLSLIHTTNRLPLGSKSPSNARCPLVVFQPPSRSCCVRQYSTYAASNPRGSTALNDERWRRLAFSATTHPLPPSPSLRRSVQVRLPAASPPVASCTALRLNRLLAGAYALFGNAARLLTRDLGKLGT